MNGYRDFLSRALFGGGAGGPGGISSVETDGVRVIGDGTEDTPIDLSDAVRVRLLPEVTEEDQDKGVFVENGVFAVSHSLQLGDGVKNVLNIEEKRTLNVKQSSFITDNGVPVWMSRKAYGNGENYLLVWNADNPVDLTTGIPPNTALGSSKILISNITDRPAEYHFEVADDFLHNGNPCYRTMAYVGGDGWGMAGQYNFLFSDGSSMADHNSVFSFFFAIAKNGSNKMYFGGDQFSDGNCCFTLKQESGGNNSFFVFYYGDSTGRINLTSDKVEIGEWHHVLVSFAKTEKRTTYYLDGVRKCSVTGKGNPSAVHGYSLCYPNSPAGYLDQIQWWLVDNSEIAAYQGDTIPVPTAESGVTSELTTRISDVQDQEDYYLWGQSARGLVRVPGNTLLWRSADAVPVQYTNALGMCHYLDASNPTLMLCDNVRAISALRFWVRSASTVVGNIVLTIAANGTAIKTVTIPVTATDVRQVIDFDAPASGMVTITRDTSAATDTLKDTDTVTAIVGTDIEVVA